MIIILEEVEQEIEEMVKKRYDLDNTFSDNFWKKDYNKEKKDYIHKILKNYGYLSSSIGFWKLSKIKERFPLFKKSKNFTKCKYFELIKPIDNGELDIYHCNHPKNEESYCEFVFCPKNKQIEFFM